MPVTTWRRPVLAPVYALVTAFVVAVGLGLATGAPSSAATLRIEQTDPELTGSLIEIRDQAGAVAVGELSAQGTYELPDKARGRTVCLRLPARWHVTAPPMTGECTAAPLPDRPNADFPVTVSKDGRVRVEFTGSQGDQVAALLAQTTVSVTPVESGPPDASGVYQPRTDLTGKTVCVTPPLGWTVRTPRTERRDTERCLTSAVTNPHDDITFTLDQGGR
ncbi:hypothetical protein [Actinocrispum sp. NPDC049592]|uniref:hypothetical protein n=1 Tax=Actinocrispum sp. NPDC049592 TaxID=3154835 RepID=UPI003412A865